MSSALRQALSHAVHSALCVFSSPNKVQLPRGTFFERRVNINGKFVSYLYRTLTPAEKELHYAKIVARHKAHQKDTTVRETT